MAQTKYYAKLDRPELKGHALVAQFGHAKFAAKSKTVSMATKLRTVKGFSYTWKSGGPGVTNSGLILRTTGTVVNRIVRVTRATLGGASSGASFWYELLGW